MMSGNRKLFWWGAALVALLLTVLWLAVPRDTLTTEERKLVGVWCGLATHSPDEPYAWVAERRADRTVAIRFKFYWREAVAGGDVWRCEESLAEVGRWWMKDGIYYTATRHAHGGVSLLTRIWLLVTLGSLPSSTQFAEAYAVRRSDGTVFDYENVARADGRNPPHFFHSLKTSEGVPMPDEPLPPERWAGHQAP